MYSTVFDYASLHLIKCALFYAINKSNHDSESLSQIYRQLYVVLCVEAFCSEQRTVQCTVILTLTAGLRTKLPFFNQAREGDGILLRMQINQKARLPEVICSDAFPCAYIHLHVFF